MGFPDRTSRTDIGPTLENERPVTNPLKEIPAGAFNEAFWQAAGMSQVTPKAVLHCTVSGGVVTVAAQGLTWDPDGALANIVFTYINAGYYEFAFANQYPDEAGVNQSTNITGGMVQVTDLEEEYGTHDGANNSATLDDSTKAWGVNVWTNYLCYNITDGSKSLVNTNTATQMVLAGLGGGTDNDFDTGDQYAVIAAGNSLRCSVTMRNAFEGSIMFSEPKDVLTDPPAFVLWLW